MAEVSRTYEEKTAAIIENLYGEKEVVAETAGYPEGSKEPGIVDRLTPKGESIDTHYTKNYGEWGGAKWVVKGELDDGMKPAVNLPNDSTIGELIVALKDAGLVTPDDWTASALKCPSTAAMPTEETASNSGHISSISIADGVLKIDLDCAVEDLDDADHGSTWGTHKWIGFGVRTGLDSIVGVKFTDDTGASATLTSDDAGEADTLGLSAGDFVLYIKAEDVKYLSGDKSFTLEYPGYKTTTFKMKICEGAD